MLINRIPIYEVMKMRTGSGYMVVRYNNKHMIRYGMYTVLFWYEEKQEAINACNDLSHFNYVV